MRIATNISELIDALPTYQIEYVASEELRRAAASTRYEMMVVDIDATKHKVRLPVGLTFKNPDITVIGVSATCHSGRSWDAQCAEFLELGGACLLSHPLNQRLLLAWIAQFRRYRGLSAADVSLRDGRFKIYIAQRRATFDGRDIPLSPSQTSVLMILAEHKDGTITSEDISTTLATGNPTHPMNQRQVTRCIDRLRDKLDNMHSGLSRCIVTERGRGYKLADGS